MAVVLLFALNINLATGAIAATPGVSCPDLNVTLNGSNDVQSPDWLIFDGSTGTCTIKSAGDYTKTPNELYGYTYAGFINPHTEGNGTQVWSLNNYCYSGSCSRASTAFGSGSSYGGHSYVECAISSGCSGGFTFQDKNNQTVTVNYTIPAGTANITNVTVSGGVFDPPPALSTTTAVQSTTLTVDTAFTAFAPVTASGGTSPLTYTLRNAADTASATLPTGLAFDASTGVISGTPRAAMTQTSYVVKVTDSASTPASSSQSFSLTVNKANQTINFPTIANTSYGTVFSGNDGSRNRFALSSSIVGSGYGTVTASSGLSVINYSTNDNSICSVSSYVTGNALIGDIYRLAINGPGVCTVTANQSGNGNYNAASSASQSFTIAKGDQGLYAYNVPSAKTFASNGTYTVVISSLTSPYTDPQSYGTSHTQLTPSMSTAKSPDICSVGSVTADSHYAGGPAGTWYYGYATVTMLKPGTCVVTASQAGDTNYNAAPDKDFSISQTAPTLSSTLANPSSYSFNSGVAITAFTPVTGTGGYGSYTYSVSPTLPTGLSINKDTGEISGIPSVVSLQTTYTVTVSDQASQTSTKQFALTINSGTQTITFAKPSDVTYSPTGSRTLSAQGGASNNPVTFASQTQNVCTTGDINGATVSYVKAGTCTIQASQAGSSTYAAATPVSQSFTINKADQEQLQASASPDTIAYGGTAALATTGGSGTGDVSFAVTAGNSYCSVSGTTLTGTGTGQCTVTATKAADANYNVAYAMVDVTVTRAAQGTSQTIASSMTCQDQTLIPVNTSFYMVFDAATGVCTASASPLTAPAYGASLESYHYNYGGTDIVESKGSFLENGIGFSGFKISCNASSCLKTPTGTSKGGKTQKLTFTQNYDGFAIQNASGTFDFGTVTTGASPLSVLADSSSITYGQTTKVTVSGGAGTGALSVAGTNGVCTVGALDGNNQATVTSTGAGTCTVTATKAADANYTSGTAAATITVNKVGQTISFTAPGTQTFAPQVSVAVSASGGASNNPVTFTSDTTSICTTSGTNGSTVSFVKAGNCTIRAAQLGNSNYLAADPVTGTFTIDKAGQTINFTDPMDIANFVANAQVNLVASGGASGNEVTFASTTASVCTVSGSSVTVKNAGTCSITASQAGDDRYLPADAVQSFSIGKAVQTITFTPLSNISEFVPNATVSLLATGGGSGNVVTFASTTTAVCTVSKNTATIIAAGTCSITASQAGNDNYAKADEVPQSFSIGKAAQTITFKPLSNISKFVPNATVSLLATGGNSGNQVTFTSNATGVCTVVGSTATILTPGVCKITASQAGNDNYNAAKDVQQSFVINATPVADAGNAQTISTGATVTLDGSKSTDPDNGKLTYSWRQIVGTSVDLSDATAVNPSFRAPTLATGISSEDLTFELTVNDGQTSSPAATVKVTVNAPVTATLTTSIQAPATGQTVDLVFTLNGTQASSLTPFHMFATVSPTSQLLQLALKPPPAPTVAFFVDGSPIAICQAVPLSGNVATCSWVATPGQHSFSAKANNSAVNATAVSTGQTIVTTVNQASTNSAAIGGFLSDRANQIVTNLPGTQRQIDRLNAAQQAQTSSQSSSNFASGSTGDPLSSDKGDLTLNTSRLGSGPTGASITASRLGVASGEAIGPTSVGQQDMLGFQSFLYNYLKTAGETGNFGQFNFSGPLDMQANFGAGGSHVAFKASLSQMLNWQQQRDQKEMAALGFGKGGGSNYFMPLDIWTEGVYTSYSGSRSGQFGMATLGTDYVFNPNFLAGFYGQFDVMNQTSGTAISGKGWMIGPYATLRLGENVFWAARAGWGKSANAITPTSVGTDNFASTRWLVSSSLSGRWNADNGLAFAPTASFTYFDDRSDSYVDSFGVTIPGVDTNLGQLKLSPELSYGFLTDSDLWIEPSIAPELIWNFAATNVDGLGALSDTATGPTGLRGRVKAGLNFKTPHGITLGLTGSYDGIGSASYSSLSGQATVNVPLN